MARARHAPEERERAGAIMARVAAALLGNYAFTLGVASLAAVLLALAGMARSEAATLASMLGFPLFLVMLLAAFHTRRLVRFWGIIAVGAAVSNALAHLLARVWA